MERRTRTVLFVAGACLLVLSLVLFLWLPWNPFEADAGPLDEWVPNDVDAVLRCDAGAVRRSTVGGRLWDGPAGRRLRDALGLDAKLDAVREFDRRLAALPFAGDDPPSVERDLFGGEVLVALRGDDLLLLSRISGRAKAIDLIRKAGDESLAQMHLRVEGAAYVVAAGEREIRFARRRDVLMVSTSKELLDSALGLSGGWKGSIAARAEYRDARASAPVGPTIAAWSNGPTLQRFVGSPPIVEPMIRPALEHGASARIDLGAPESVSASIRFVAPARAAPLDVAPLCDDAARYAMPLETFAQGALPTSAKDAVLDLFDSQPEARRRLAEDVLLSAGSSVAEVVGDIARHLQDGVGFVVARPPETDRLKLDDPEGDPTEPLPATVVVFRLADPDPAAFLADVQRHAEALFGPKARLDEAPGPRGTTIRRAADVHIGPEWAMFTPALAVVGRDVVFSSNEAYLRRALEEDRAVVPSRPCLASVRLHVDLLKRRLDDLRWNVADRVTRRDWGAERREVREEVERDHPALSNQERQRLEDDEIERRIADRKQRLFPEASRGYVESLSWLDGFGLAELRGEREFGGIRVDVKVGVRAP
jgi:hypothetical protein